MVVLSGILQRNRAPQLQNRQPERKRYVLEFPNAVVVNAVERKRAQMSAKERKRKSAKEAQKRRKRAQRALLRKNCKQPGLKQPGLGTPNMCNHGTWAHGD